MVDIGRYNMSLVMKIIILFYYFTRNYHSVICYTVTCDFELDECGWTLDSTWKVYPSGSTPDTASSGPISDHTTGNGSYARFMATRLPESNQFGIMSTNTSFQQSILFSFWYFMHGTQIGTLALVVNDRTLWQKSKRQGIPAWYQANVTLPVGVDIRINFVANRTGIGRSSDIAIDDIILHGEPMPISTRTTITRPTTTPRARFNASCDFDVDKELCGWKSDTKYGWKVIHERETGITIGPSSDYSSIMRISDDGKICQIPYEEKKEQYFYCIPNKKTLQCKGTDNKWFNCRDGGFVQIRTNQFDQVGERSQFDSPILDALSEEGCVQFHYNIAGSDNDWLNVYVEDYWSGNQLCVWHMNGSSVPDRWVASEAPLKTEKEGKYQIVFEARKGKAGGMGVVSLDHIIVSPNRCSGKYPVIECPPEEVTTSTSTTTITTTSNVVTTTTSIYTDTPTVFNSTVITTKTSTTPSTTATTFTISQATPTTSFAEISTPLIVTTMTKSLTPSEASTSTTRTSIIPLVTTVSSTSSTTTTLTTIYNPDVDVPETSTTRGSPKKASLIGSIVGTLASVCIVILVVGMYVNRQKLHAWYRARSNSKEEIIPKYSNGDLTDACVRLENIRERSTSSLA